MHAPSTVPIWMNGSVLILSHPKKGRWVKEWAKFWKLTRPLHDHCIPNQSFAHHTILIFRPLFRYCSRCGLLVHYHPRVGGKTSLISPPSIILPGRPPTAIPPCPPSCRNWVASARCNQEKGRGGHLPRTSHAARLHSPAALTVATHTPSHANYIAPKTGEPAAKKQVATPSESRHG